MDADAVLASLTDEPKQFPDCCCSISLRLVSTLLELLPRGGGSLVLSIGAGSGLLEDILRRKSEPHDMNLLGVEVPSCQNKYLPAERMLRVPSSTDLHRDALLADALLFVYPRKSSLLQAYLDAFVRGALQIVVLILNRNDWIDFAPILASAFSQVEIIDNSGLPTYEVLAMASSVKVAP